MITSTGRGTLVDGFQHPSNLKSLRRNRRIAGGWQRMLVGAG